MDRRYVNLKTLSNRKASQLGVFLTAATLLTGCKKEEIRTYSVPKEDHSPKTFGSEEAAQPHFHATTPTNWVEQGASGFRVATYNVVNEAGDKAEITVIPLPGEAGSDLENVNRWRGQIQLPPVQEADLASLRETVAAEAGMASLYDLTGTNPATGKPTRMLAAVISEPGSNLFLKMMGSEKVVAAEKEAFRTFVKTAALHAGTEGHGAEVAAATPAPAPEVAGKAPSSGSEPAWTLPEGWKEQAPGSMVKARFQTGGGTDVTVSVFPGDVGGMLANVNRWRGQLGMSSITEIELVRSTSKIEVNGLTGTLVDLTNEKAAGEKKSPNRLVAVVLPQKGQTWFFKIIGDNQVVTGEKAAFLKFVQSTRFPNA